METGKRLTNSAVTVRVVRRLLYRGARARLGRLLTKAYPVEVARLLSTLKGSERALAFSILLDECGAPHIASVLSEMSPADSIALLEALTPAQIARYLSELPADDATDLASRLHDPLAAEVLALMEAEPAADVRELLEHQERTAGRIMTPDFFALDEEMTISEAVTALQKRSEEFEMVFYLYIVDRRDHLVGVVSLRKLLTTQPSTQLKRIMFSEVISVNTGADQEEVARLVAEYNLLAIPVVDDADKLVGIVTVDDVIDVLQDEAAEDLLALAGVTPEERVTTSAARALRLRAPWVLLNLITTFFPAFVIARFDWAISRYAVLAAIVTMPMGMGGNTATQTLAVMIRGLALNEVSSVPQVVLKQAIVGLGNGVINGLIGSFVVALVFKSFYLGLVLASSMIINMLVAALAGTLIPIGLKKLNIDPAVASSVFVTTFTDVAGSLSFLGIASLLIDKFPRM